MAEQDAKRWLRTRAMATGRRIVHLARDIVTARAPATAMGVRKDAATSTGMGIPKGMGTPAEMGTPGDIAIAKSQEVRDRSAP